MNMTTKMIAAVLLGGVFTLTGCSKDKDIDALPENAMLLNAEGFAAHNGAKTTVNGTAVAWAGGESVKLNGTNYTVNISDGKAYVEGSAALLSDDVVYGYNPASMVTSGDASTRPTVTLPWRITSSFSGSQQVLDLPMVAYTTENDGKAVRFKHLTAAVNVRVKNSVGTTLYIDSVEITSTNYQLCGAKTLDLTADNLGVTAATTADASLKSVRVYFGFNAVSVANNGTKDVQVPILPIPASEPLTIKVYSHRVMDGGYAKAHYGYNYERTINTTPLLERNKMATVQINMDPDGNSTYITKKQRGQFKVAASDYVRFSQGNLQWTGRTKKYNFATNQYDYIGNAAGNNTSTDRESQSSPIDLYGWATSGYKHNSAHYYTPAATSTTAVNYCVAEDRSTYSLTRAGVEGKADWGVYASTGGDGSGHYTFVDGITYSSSNPWIVLTNSEWAYLLSTRTGTATVNGTANARYTCAKIYAEDRSTYTDGLLLFPQSFDVPTFIDGSSWGTINGKSAYGTKIYANDWKMLEVLGCAFLPKAGYRSGTNTSSYTGRGMYWSSTSTTTAADAYALYFEGNTQFNTGFSWKKYYGCSVRLVRHL